jgi:hypothetical protein
MENGTDCFGFALHPQEKCVSLGGYSGEIPMRFERLTVGGPFRLVLTLPRL